VWQRVKKHTALQIFSLVNNPVLLIVPTCKGRKMAGRDGTGRGVYPVSLMMMMMMMKRGFI